MAERKTSDYSTFIGEHPDFHTRQEKGFSPDSLALGEGFKPIQYSAQEVEEFFGFDSKEYFINVEDLKEVIFLCTKGAGGDIDRERFLKELKLKGDEKR